MVGSAKDTRGRHCPFGEGQLGPTSVAMQFLSDNAPTLLTTTKRIEGELIRLGPASHFGGSLNLDIATISAGQTSGLDIERSACTAVWALGRQGTLFLFFHNYRSIDGDPPVGRFCWFKVVWRLPIGQQWMIKTRHGEQNTKNWPPGFLRIALSDAGEGDHWEKRASTYS